MTARKFVLAAIGSAAVAGAVSATVASALGLGAHADALLGDDSSLGANAGPVAAAADLGSIFPGGLPSVTLPGLPSLPNLTSIDGGLLSLGLDPQHGSATVSGGAAGVSGSGGATVTIPGLPSLPALPSVPASSGAPTLPGLPSLPVSLPGLTGTVQSVAWSVTAAVLTSCCA